MRCFTLALIAAAVALAQTPRTNVESGKRYPRIVIRGAIVVDGSGTPASGPKDIVIENNMITDVVSADAMAAGRGARRVVGDINIDATGKYVLPGLIDAHAHVQDERGGIAQPQDYELKIWLACGITTVRDVGSDTRKTLVLRAQERRRRGGVATDFCVSDDRIAEIGRGGAGAGSRAACADGGRIEIHRHQSRRDGSGRG